MKVLKKKFLIILVNRRKMIAQIQSGDKTDADQF